MDDDSISYFYTKKYNDNLIKKIDESTYLNLQSNPLYITTYTGDYNGKFQTLDEANSQLPGLIIFLSDIDDDASQV